MSSIKFIIIVIVFSLLLLFRFLSVSQNQPQYQDNQHVRFVATVREEPEIKKGKQRVRVQTPHGVPVTIILSALPVYQYGDRLRVTGTLKRSDYEGRVFWLLYYPRIQIVGKEQNLFSQAAMGIRGKAKDLFEGTLPPVPAALLAGMLFGGRHGMPEDFLEALRTTGVLHVIAASGANVAFVAGALLAVLGRMLRRQYALVLGIAGIGFYAFLAGFEPSIVRAAIMGSIAFAAAILGRQNVSIIALLLTGYVMLFVDPDLLSDVGFQLSFLATLGIIVIKPLLDNGLDKLARWGRMGGLGDDVTTTTAAQIGVVPVLLGTFGQFSLLSILANALILWTIPIVMAFGAFGLLVAIVVEPVGKLIVLLCLPFLWLFEWVVRGVGEVGMVWRIVSVAEFPWVLGVGYYLIVLAMVVFFQKRQGQRANRQKSLREEIGM